MSSLIGKDSVHNNNMSNMEEKEDVMGRKIIIYVTNIWM
jgi:hypothetical protein